MDAVFSYTFVVFFGVVLVACAVSRRKKRGSKDKILDDIYSDYEKRMEKFK